MLLTYSASLFYIPPWLERLVGQREKRILEQDDCIVTCYYPETLSLVTTHLENGALKMAVKKEDVPRPDRVKYVYSAKLGEWFSFNWETKTISG